MPERRVHLTESSAKRIASAVRAVENGGRDMPGVTFRQPGGDDGGIRLCKTSATFTKGTTATLNVWESGTPPSETQSTGVTVAGVVNKFATIASGKWVAIAQAGNGSWYVIAAECS